ncbi:MAG: hypothetical protein DI529_07990 [Chryseobacterium sp.]|nr:MAG: hypothetical protein DI529_07990 [Chryseobacterium sp.]
MMKKIITFITLLCLLAVQSCRQDEKMNELREDLQGKTELSQKETFRNLTTDSKVKIWESKLNQVLIQDLTKEQRVLVEALKGEIKNMNSPTYNGVKLIELGIALAKITPENDYIKMVSSLENYTTTKNVKIGKINNVFVVKDLENFLIRVKKRNKLIIEESQSSGGITNKKPVCNCSWTCGMYGGVDDNCTASNGGCGFLWLQDCTGHIGY